jgi:hypothetical protein
LPREVGLGAKLFNAVSYPLFFSLWFTSHRCSIITM